MPRSFSILLSLLGLCLATGCASQPPAAGPPTTLAAPWTGVYTPSATPLAVTSNTRVSLLADGDVCVARGEKFIAGALPLSSVSASSVYTYDAQPVAVPGGWGYRYRSVLQETISVP